MPNVSLLMPPTKKATSMSSLSIRQSATSWKTATRKHADVSILKRQSTAKCQTTSPCQPELKREPIPPCQPTPEHRPMSKCQPVPTDRHVSKHQSALKRSVTSRRQSIRLGLVFTSFLLFPATIFYFSPYLSVLGPFQGILPGSLVAFGALFLLSFFLRRGFCGWLCPTGGLQEMVATIQPKLSKLGWRCAIKFVIWVPWICAIAAGAVVAGGIHTVDLAFKTEHGLSVASIHGLLIYLGIVALFFVIDLIVGRRGACHYICWIAPFMIIGETIGRLLHLPQLHVHGVSNTCVHCGACERACPMSLPVSTLAAGEAAIDSTECIQCAACCDACRHNALAIGFGPIRKKDFIMR